MRVTRNAVTEKQGTTGEGNICRAIAWPPRPAAWSDACCFALLSTRTRPAVQPRPVGKCVEVEPRSCSLYNYLQRRVEKRPVPEMVPTHFGTGWTTRNNTWLARTVPQKQQTPAKRGFEGLVGVDAPPAEVSGNLVLAGPDTRPVKRLWYQIFVTLRKCQKAIQPPPMIPPFQCLDSRCFGPGSVNPPTRGSVQGGGDNLL